MALHIELLSPAREEEYDAFLNECPASMLYYSRNYRQFLQNILPDSGANYLVAYESGRLAAVLPMFVKLNPRLGNVMNSLPFYGSHGGMLAVPSAQNADAAKQTLVAASNDLCIAKGVVASTIIANPLAPDSEFCDKHLPWTLKDSRIGQITPLPAEWRTDAELDEKLFQQFHHKTRNSIRKAVQSNVILTHDSSIDALQALSTLHRNNMEAVNGHYKPWDIFLAIRESFSYDKDYRVFVARKDDKVVAALLVFFFNKTAEYYIPATDPGYRVLQPMSLLVFEAMREAAKRGHRYWNWGGTWAAQSGVYHFKKRWGTYDQPYTYYVNIREDHVLQHPREELLAEYPYFYVTPFEQLNAPPVTKPHAI
jgi:hypothetical protein